MAPADDHRQMLGAVSNEMVRLMSEHFGRGPTSAKAYLCDDFIVCALKGGLTQFEETLLRGDDREAVRGLRSRFQELMEDTFRRSVERITGRPVVNYHSQVVFDPDYVFEIFVLGGNGEQPPRGPTSHG